MPLLNVPHDISESRSPDFRMLLEVRPQLIQRGGGNREPFATDSVEAVHTPLMLAQRRFGQCKQPGEIFSRSDAKLGNRQNAKAIRILRSGSLRAPRCEGMLRDEMHIERLVSYLVVRQPE